MLNARESFVLGATSKMGNSRPVVSGDVDVHRSDKSSTYEMTVCRPRGDEPAASAHARVLVKYSLYFP